MKEDCKSKYKSFIAHYEITTEELIFIEVYNQRNK